MISSRFQIPLRGSAVALSVAAVSILSLAACNSTRSTPTPNGVAVNTTVTPELATRAPIDIAILPVANLSGTDIPADELRGAFQRGLVIRKYSPLAFEYVDRNISEASYSPGASQEQGVMAIEVQRWDTSQWEAHNSVDATIRVRLLDATTGGVELWKAETNRRFEFGSAFDHLATQSARLHVACESIAAEMLERLPARRTTVPGG